MEVSRISHYALIVVALLLIVSVALNVVLFERARGYYFEMMAMRHLIKSWKVL